MTLRDVDPGFRDPEKVQTFQLTIPSSDVAVAAQTEEAIAQRTLQMRRDVLDRLAAIPGVEAAGFWSSSDGLNWNPPGAWIRAG